MQRETSFARSAVAGAAAAGAATVAFHPVDTVKTLLQARQSKLPRPSQGSVLAVVRALGLGGLYRGVVPATLSMAPACAVRMATYEAIKAPLLRDGGRLVAAG